MTYAERIAEKANEAEVLTAYANATTGVDDENLGDAVRTLVANYGGGEKPWVKIADLDFATAGGDIRIDGLDDVTEFYMEWHGIQNATSTDSGFNNAYINGIGFSQAPVPIRKSGAVSHGYTMLKYNGLIWDCVQSNGAISNTNRSFSTGNSMRPYNVVRGIGKAKSIRLENTSQYKPVTGTLEIWAR